jgi:hypothetical protein
MTAMGRCKSHRERFLKDYNDGYPKDMNAYHRRIANSQEIKYIPTRLFPNRVRPLYAQLRVSRCDGTLDGIAYLPYEAVRQRTRKFEASGQTEVFAPFQFDVRRANTVAIERFIQCVFPQSFEYYHLDLWN